MQRILVTLLLASLALTAHSSEVEDPVGLFFSPIDPQTLIEGDYVAALREYEESSQLNLTDAGTRIDMARLYAATREYEKAAAELEAAVELLGDREDVPRLKLSLGKLYLKLGLFDKALGYLSGNGGNDFLIGYCYERLAECDSALQHYSVVTFSGDELSDLASYHSASCLYELGRYQEALDVASRLREDSPLSVYVSHAEHLIPSCYEGLGMHEKAIHLRNQMRKKDPALEPAMRYYIGQSYESMKDGIRAREEYTYIITNYPRSKYGLLSLEALKKISALKGRSLYHAGRVHYYRGGYRQAAEYFTSYLKKYPKGKYTRDARYLRGKCYVRLRMYTDAEISFEQLAKSVASEKERARYLFDLAKAQDQEGRNEMAEGSFETVAEIRVSSLTDDAKYRKGLIQEEKGKLEESFNTFMSVKNGDYADNALYRAGMVAFSLGRMDLAREALHRLVYLHTGSGFETAARYWLGRAFEGLDSLDAAVRLYRSVNAMDPFGYYGYKARENLRERTGEKYVTPVSDSDVEAWIGTWAPDASPPSDYERKRLERGLLLLDAGLTEVGASEIERIDVRNPLSCYLAARACSNSGLDFKAISLARKLMRMAADSGSTDVPKELLRFSYPLSFLPSALLATEAKEIDPLLILAMIREESLFLTDAVSPAGAVGLMQVMPRTGEEMAKRSDQNGFQIEELLRPSTSVSFGSRYVLEQLGEFKDIELAIAAYNAGPAVVRKWKERFNTPQIDYLLELIPYPETRIYVKSVLASWWTYREIWSTTSYPGP
jgi:tetratricopeptide (TPR) repeat protein